MPPSINTRPAPTVSGSWVTSGRCCANALPAARKTITLMTSVLMLLELPLAVDQRGHGTGIDQFDAHHGLEFARGNGQLCRTQFSHDAFVQRARFFRGRRRVERRASSLSDVAVERELRHDKDAAADVGDRTVHVT